MQNVYYVPTNQSRVFRVIPTNESTGPGRYSSDDHRNDILVPPAGLHTAHQSQNKKKSRPTSLQTSHQFTSQKCLDFSGHSDCLLSAAFPVHLNDDHPLHVPPQRRLPGHVRLAGEPEPDVDNNHPPGCRLPDLHHPEAPPISALTVGRELSDNCPE